MGTASLGCRFGRGNAKMAGGTGCGEDAAGERNAQLTFLFIVHGGLLQQLQSLQPDNFDFLFDASELHVTGDKLTLPLFSKGSCEGIRKT